MSILILNIKAPESLVNPTNDLPTAYLKQLNIQGNKVDQLAHANL